MKKTTNSSFISDEVNSPSFSKRIGAMFYDWLLCLACLFVFVGIAVTINQGNTISDNQKPFLTLGLFGIIFAYFVGFWRQGGQTPGMKVWKIQLTADEPPADANKLVTRFFIVVLTLGITVLFSFFTNDKRGLHDKLSKTSLKTLKG